VAKTRENLGKVEEKAHFCLGKVENRAADLAGLTQAPA
jgi:hypothetical protein